MKYMNLKSINEYKMRNFIFIHITLFLIIITFISCTYKKQNKDNYRIEFIKKAEGMNQNVLGKQLNSPIKILGDSIFNKKKVVLLITVGSDCSGCREKGYQFISRINDSNNKRIAFIVGTGLNEKFEKQYNGMIGRMYEDEKAIIKHELNLFHTPSVVLLDQNSMVDRILGIFPYDTVDGYNEGKEFDEFIEAVLAL